MKTKDMFTDILQPCKHCGGSAGKLYSILGWNLHRGVFLACDGCSFQTHKVYINDDSDRYLALRWNMGVPYEVVKQTDLKGHSVFLSSKEFYERSGGLTPQTIKQFHAAARRHRSSTEFFKNHFIWDNDVRMHW